MDNDLTGHPTGATPLDEDDLQGLIPTWVATRRDLDVVEHENIEAATRWAFGRRRVVGDVRDLLTVDFTNRVHRKMFGDVWRWAGVFRQRVTNIGVEPHQITEKLRDALDDAAYWHEHGTFAPTDVAIRLHHRVVEVHPYSNGNGRHSRFMADLYLRGRGLPRLPWGGSPLGGEHQLRAAYLAALRDADAGDYGPLVRFATSSG